MDMSLLLRPSKAEPQLLYANVLPENKNANVTYIKVSNSAEALGYIASNYYDNPSEKIEVVAVTGTNGKTTTATSALFSH
jgi:UDP-N-acetylmuramoyl-L-alanyl-D-glutamate--2,6-diaminopimelate ligase